MARYRLSRSPLETELTALAADTLACLRFYSRLAPVSLTAAAGPPPAFGRMVRMLPAAGALIGCAGAAALLLAAWIGLPPLLAAIACVAMLVRVTGALHEDGLADTADGLGGGATRQRKLDIMRDSRIGTYGAAALVLALAARAAALAALLDRYGPWGTAAAVVAAAAVSRVAGLIPLLVLPPARSDGLAHAAGRPAPETMALAAVLAVGLALVLSGPWAGYRVGALACVAAALASAYLASLAYRHLGGHTGDVAGAAQQVAEIAFLSALLIRGSLG